jgi:hypoxanthine phosphoribosyltransferase
MTQCDPPKIRSLIEKHLGKDKAKEYDTIVEQCKLGQALKDDRVWAPLCPEYPNLKGVTCEEIDKFLSATQTLKRGQIGNLETINNKIIFNKDYLHHVKVYDRDEAYEAFKNIGELIEEDSPGILQDPSTIFVTTPRGGHEMLSIFTYANDISKKQIPSDIQWSHIAHEGYSTMHEHEYRKDPHKKAVDDDAKYFTEIYGKDWMGHHSDPVKTIFIVDDIIASGEQIHHTKIELDAMFPDATINSITLCKRSDDVVSPALPQEIKKYYTDAETIGIHEFKIANRNKLPLEANQYITCLFPHACPDGESDQLMIDLMGGERCPPEKRIARRDL